MYWKQQELDRLRRQQALEEAENARLAAQAMQHTHEDQHTTRVTLLDRLRHMTNAVLSRTPARRDVRQTDEMLRSLPAFDG